MTVTMTAREWRRSKQVVVRAQQPTHLPNRGGDPTVRRLLRFCGKPTRSRPNTDMIPIA